MWFLILPSVSVAVFGVLLAVARKRDAAYEAERRCGSDDIEMQTPLIMPADEEDDDDDVVVTTDVMSWLNDASDRIILTAGPVVKTVHAPAGTSTFVSFTARNIEFELWLGGPSYIGPFPRLKRALTDGPGVEITRTQMAIERCIVQGC